MRILVEYQGTRPDEIIDDIEKVVFHDEGNVYYKSWSKAERILEGIKKVIVYE